MKKNIALVWGGYSSEAVVSVESKKGLMSFLDYDRYNIYPLYITKNSWTVDIEHETYEIDKNDFSFVRKGAKIKFDFAYITIHGTPGEDGRLQGYLEMLGIPHSTCSLETSALLFNKYYCNVFLKNFGINVADSILLRDYTPCMIDEIVCKIGLPLFVKPNIGGSSFATTKVKNIEELDSAIKISFKEAQQVIIESFIDGIEVTCGCYQIGNQTNVLPITEVVSKNDFFDYEAKYQGAVEEITPARISIDLTNKIHFLTKQIYTLVGAKGLIRVDFIISKNEPYLLEVNTTPGMTKTSLIPQQMSAAGLNIKNVLSEIIDFELNKNIY